MRPCALRLRLASGRPDRMLQGSKVYGFAFQRCEPCNKAHLPCMQSPIRSSALQKRCEACIQQLCIAKDASAITPCVRGRRHGQLQLQRILLRCPLSAVRCPLSRSKMRALESQLAFIAQSLLSLHGARIHAHTHKPHSANSLASRPLPSSVPCVLAQIPLGDNN